MLVLIVRITNSTIQPIPNRFFLSTYSTGRKIKYASLNMKHTKVTCLHGICTPLLLTTSLFFKSVKKGILRTVYFIAEQTSTRKWYLDDKQVDTPLFFTSPSWQKILPYFKFVSLATTLFLMASELWLLQFWTTVYSVVICKLMSHFKSVKLTE